MAEPVAVPEETAEARVFALPKAVARALEPGNGRSHRVETEDELCPGLDRDGVSYDPQDLPAALKMLDRQTVSTVTTRWLACPTRS